MRDGPKAVGREYIFAWGCTTVCGSPSRVTTCDLIPKEGVCPADVCRDSTLLSDSQQWREGRYFLYLSQVRAILQTASILWSSESTSE